MPKATLLLSGLEASGGEGRQGETPKADEKTAKLREDHGKDLPRPLSAKGLGKKVSERESKGRIFSRQERSPA